MSSPPRLTRAALVLALLPACAFFRHLVGRDTVDLEKADVRSMGVDIRKDQKTICPRERVQMAVFADVVLDGEDKPQKVETWAGSGAVNKNGKLDFDEFAFKSSEGTFDAEGWFSPRPDLLATAGHEFEIRSVFKRRPDKFTFTTNYKPDYDCIKASGHDGASGHGGTEGAAGSDGSRGTDGAYSTTTNPPTTPGGVSTTSTTQGPGGNGGNGGPGGPGGPGSDGGAGPRISVELTFAKTPFYDKLVVARLQGDVNDVLLYPAETALALHANGGPGGAGGNGGRGGRGGQGGSGNPPGSNGADGAQGHGGRGGNGGPGGIVDIVFDPRFEADLRAALKPEAMGGSPGPGGSGGGSRGDAGRDGTIRWRSGNPKASLADLPGVTPL
jgi:hypothetical protein